MSREDTQKRIDTVEESYEFFLAYAAQGLSGEGAERGSDQVRGFLERMNEALTGMGQAVSRIVREEKLTPVESYQGMIDVLERDAASTQAAVQLVLAQSVISSQLIDNFNASIHVRALLTDLFLLDEVLKGVQAV